ncbi:MAG: acyltransferase [Egibacteraceae bacterium]
MLINERSKRIIPFQPGDAKRVGQGCFYLDLIVWLNGEHVELGDHVGFNYGCYVNGYGGLSVSDHTVIGPGSMIHTANHEMNDLDRPIAGQGWVAAPVEIGEDCWIGMNVCILPGVRIGKGCVIGAGSVVTKLVPDYSVAVGNPAKVIRTRG